MTKPRLTRFYGIWVCCGGGVIGHGFTPMAAYAEFQRRLGTP